MLLDGDQYAACSDKDPDAILPQPSAEQLAYVISPLVPQAIQKVFARHMAR